MVRENPQPDEPKDEKLETGIRRAERFPVETKDPELERNDRPIDIRGDAVPEKRG